MDIAKAVFLGVLQGLTEFLPVSSSGHLVIAQKLMPGGIDEALALDVCLHFGTLLAVLIYFRADLFDMARALFASDGAAQTGDQRRRIGLLALATLPISIVGLTMRESVEHAFDSITAVGVALIATSLLLAFAMRRLEGRRRVEEMRASEALIIGLFQAFAVIPGVSRSGATIVAGLMRGLAPDAAARFAFLLSLPAILGAVALNFAAVGRLLDGQASAVAAGTAAAAVTGWLAIDLMMRAVRLGRLVPFAVYCAILGAAALCMGMASGQA